MYFTQVRCNTLWDKSESLPHLIIAFLQGVQDRGGDLSRRLVEPGVGTSSLSFLAHRYLQSSTCGEEIAGHGQGVHVGGKMDTNLRPPRDRALQLAEKRPEQTHR